MMRLLDLSTRIYLERGRTLGALGQLRDAIESLDRSLEFSRDLNNETPLEVHDLRQKTLKSFIKLKLDQGGAEIDLENWSGAIVRYSEILEFEQLEPSVWFLRGYAYYNSGKYVKAKEDFDEAIKLDPEYSEAYSQRSIVRDELGQTDLALQDIEKALEIKPECYSLYGIKADLLEKKGNLRLALNTYDSIILNCPDSQEVHIARVDKSKLLTRMGALQEAIVECSACIEFKADDDSLYGMRALLYLNIREPQLALSDATQAIRLNPGYFMHYFLRANILKDHLKSYDLSIEDFSRGLSLNPPPETEVKSLIMRSSLYGLVENYREEIADANQAIRIYQESKLNDTAMLSKAYILRAYGYHSTGDNHKAVSDITSAINMGIDVDSTLIEAYQFRAKRYMEISEYRKAVKDLQQLQRTFQSSKQQLEESSAQSYAHSYILKSLSYIKLGEVSEALDAAHESARLFKSLGDVDSLQRSLQLVQMLSR